jgi:hypothetical protein
MCAPRVELPARCAPRASADWPPDAASGAAPGPALPPVHQACQVLLAWGGRGTGGGAAALGGGASGLRRKACLLVHLFFLFLRHPSRGTALTAPWVLPPRPVSLAAGRYAQAAQVYRALAERRGDAGEGAVGLAERLDCLQNALLQVGRGRAGGGGGWRGRWATKL